MCYSSTKKKKHCYSVGKAIQQMDGSLSIGLEGQDLSWLFILQWSAEYPVILGNAENHTK